AVCIEGTLGMGQTQIASVTGWETAFRCRGRGRRPDQRMIRTKERTGLSIQMLGSGVPTRGRASVNAERMREVFACWQDLYMIYRARKNDDSRGFLKQNGNEGASHDDHDND